MAQTWVGSLELSKLPQLGRDLRRQFSRCAIPGGGLRLHSLLCGGLLGRSTGAIVLRRCVHVLRGIGIGIGALDILVLHIRRSLHLLLLHCAVVVRCGCSVRSIVGVLVNHKGGLEDSRVRVRRVAAVLRGVLTPARPLSPRSSRRGLALAAAARKRTACVLRGLLASLLLGDGPVDGAADSLVQQSRRSVTMRRQSTIVRTMNIVTVGFPGGSRCTHLEHSDSKAALTHAYTGRINRSKYQADVVESEPLNRSSVSRDDWKTDVASRLIRSHGRRDGIESSALSALLSLQNRLRVLRAAAILVRLIDYTAD